MCVIKCRWKVKFNRDHLYFALTVINENRQIADRYARY